MAQLCVLAAVLVLMVPSPLFVGVPPVLAEDSAPSVKNREHCAADASDTTRRLLTADFRGDGTPVIIPAAGTAASGPSASRLPAGTVNGLQAVRAKVNTLGTQVKSLEASLTQPAWSQAIQPQLASLRGTLAGLQQDVAKLQEVNRSANMNVGIQVADALHARAQDVERALQGLAQARDATAARGAVSQISVSLGNLAKTANDPPGCCQALTCCAVAIR
jgi:hypothetical protein